MGRLSFLSFREASLGVLPPSLRYNLKAAKATSWAGRPGRLFKYLWMSASVMRMGIFPP